MVGALMGLQAASGILGIFGGLSKAKMQAAQSRHEGVMAEMRGNWNATLLETQSKDLKRRGSLLKNIAESEYELGNEQRQYFVKQKRKLDNRQTAKTKAKLAKAGVVLDEGTAQDIEVESRLISEMDTIQEFRRMGKVTEDQYISALSQVEDLFNASTDKAKQAIQTRAEGKMARVAGDAGARIARSSRWMTALGGGLSTSAQIHMTNLRYGKNTFTR